VTALKVVGLGGSLAATSRSRAALKAALAGAAEAGAKTSLLDLRELSLPFYNPELDEHPPDSVSRLVEECYAADGMVWSSPMYNGTISGSFKNALDWLHVLGHRDPPYLHDTVVGLISTAGGTQALQAINTMEFVTRALRAWAVPFVVPVGMVGSTFDADGRMVDQGLAKQLQTLGGEVVRVAGRFAADGALHRQAECDEAAERVAAAA
jgi:FMN reductase